MPYFQKDDYPELPDDTPLLCEITEIEMTRSRAFGSEEMRDQVAFLFEVVEGEFSGAKVRGWANAVFSPRSTLAKIATAALADERLEGVDTDDLMGKQLYVIGDYGEDGKSSFLRPRRFKPAVRAESNGTARRASTSTARESKAEGPPVPAAAAEPSQPVPKTGDDEIDF